MTIKRDLLLKRIINAKHNDFVKIITGIIKGQAPK